MQNLTIIFIFAITFLLSYLAGTFYKRLRQAGVVKSEPQYLAWVIFVIVALWLLFSAWWSLRTTYKTIEKEPGHWVVVEE